MKKNTIAVIGCGLIGGSLLKSLKKPDIKLIAISRSSETVEKIIKNNLADVASTDIEDIKDADFVFICTPIAKVTETIEKVAGIVSPDCIITDTASVKGFIMEFADNTDKKIRFIGGHPMAGTENKGIDSAVNGLFEGAKWVITPSKQCSKDDIKNLKKIITLTGAITVEADPKAHDMAVAFISHMPLILSQSLFALVKDYPDKNISELALKLASSGFRDMTRLAVSNPEMANDMMTYNKDNIGMAFEDLKEQINRFYGNFDMNNPDFADRIDKIITTRKNMYSPEGKNLS